MQWVNIKSGQSGYITLTIKKIARQDETNEEGVPVTVLSDFIRFLEADDSPVSEFGISNSSLEEVFLAVTNTSTPNTDISDETGCCRCCSCCCCCRRHRRQTVIEAESTETPDASLPQPRVNFEEQPNVDLALYERKLSVPTQIEALLRFYIARSWWSGKSSIFYWLVVAVFVSLNVVNGQCVRLNEKSLLCILIALASLTFLVSINQDLGWHIFTILLEEDFMIFLQCF